MHPTRYIQLSENVRRSRAKNLPTVMGQVSAATPRQRRLRELFVFHYDEFAGSCRNFADAGLAVVAIDERRGRFAGLVCLAAKAGFPNAAIIGRHGCADLYLDNSESLSLRHLAVLVEPARRWDRGHVELRYRILDLRTEHGFTDETGRELRSVACEGPAIVRCEGYALYVLQLGDPTDWPDDPRDAWDFLPERIYFDEMARFPEGSRATSLPAMPSEMLSRITRTQPPMRLTDALLAAGDEPVARLHIRGANGRRRVLRVGSHTLERGLLVGRYGRCAAGPDLIDDTVSRVHLLIVQCGDSAFAIDTGSTNGTYAGRRRAERVVRLVSGCELGLGIAGSAIRWEWIA